MDDKKAPAQPDAPDVSADLARRRPIWLALSEFYLDTELDGADFDRIVHVFRASGFNLEAVKAIDHYEVRPPLHNNLLSVAGAWAGFDEAWLYERCERGYRRRHSLVWRLNCALVKWLMAGTTGYCWRAIEERWEAS